VNRPAIPFATKNPIESSTSESSTKSFVDYASKCRSPRADSAYYRTACRMMPVAEAHPAPTGLFATKRPTMSAQIIKVSVSLVAVATSAVSLFVISWIGLALLGF
jgi:hypothetical protein